jgi:hypothetical protein
VRGHEEAAWPGRQGDLQQVTRIQPEDGPAIGGQVADPGQRRGDPVRGLEARRVQQVVDLAGPLVAAVDRADLDREPLTGYLIRVHRE